MIRALLPLVLAACGGTAAAPAVTEAPAAAPGATLETALAVCGAEASHATIAAHRCPDGTAPFGGDTDAAARARAARASQGASGHLVDRYTLPCADGPRHVFVDMHRCPER